MLHVLYRLPSNKEFQTGHCFGPASLFDLLHNPKCTGSSLSYLLIRKRCAHHSFFPQSNSAESRLHRCRPERSSGKNTCFPPPSPTCVPIWLTLSPCGRPHLVLDTSLWSCSVKLVLRK